MSHTQGATPGRHKVVVAADVATVVDETLALVVLDNTVFVVVDRGVVVCAQTSAAVNRQKRIISFFLAVQVTADEKNESDLCLVLCGERDSEAHSKIGHTHALKMNRGGQVTIFFFFFFAFASEAKRKGVCV